MLWITLACSLVGAAPDDDLRVLGDAQQPRTMLSSSLLAEARKHFDARRATVATLKTPEAWTRRQDDLKGKFLAALGAFPERTSLNARVVGRDQRAGYAVERVIFESRPGHHVTAVFYLPDTKAPVPGVLFPCGHSIEGKAGETYQRACILLAQNGLAVLCFDPIGQGERVQLPGPAGKPTISPPSDEHTMAGVGALLVGRSLAHYRTWDGIRALDYLASRPEVDPRRLGCTGNSGGGTETAYLMALDDRIAVAAPSCYITSLERLFATIGPQDAEQNIVGQVAFGMEHADYVTMRVPKPTLLCVGTRDYFDIDGAWASFREAKLTYGRFGFGERVDLFESDEPHGFTRPRREAAMRWMRRWLLGKDDAPTEVESPIMAEAQLRATTSGQVLREFAGEASVFALNATRADELDLLRARNHADRPAETLRAEVRRRLALPETNPPVIVSHGKPIHRDGSTVDRWTLTTEPGILVPVVLFRANSVAAGKPVTVYVGADRSLFAPGGPIEARVKAGEAIALDEPRGMGETTPEGLGDRSRRFGEDQREAFLALHLGRSLLGLRVFDLLRSLEALDGGTGFRLVGVGDGGPIVLHAAALDDRIKSVEVEGSILSWSAVAHATVSHGQLSAVIPGVLEAYDLPDLAKAIVPRALTIRGPKNPDGSKASQKALEAAYATAKETYRAVGKVDRLTLRAEEAEGAKTSDSSHE